MRSNEFDRKEMRILNHYRTIIQNAEFDEYDILGFLILIREHIDRRNYPYLQDFSDLMAHRNRDRGEVMSCIRKAIDNSYLTCPGSNSIQGYHGMHYNDWKNEIKKLCKEFGMHYTNSMARDILLCVFSLTQNTKYDDKKGHIGYIELFQEESGKLGLYTTEGFGDSLYICFAKSECFNFTKRYPAGRIDQPVETVRENGILRLRDNSDYII